MEIKTKIIIAFFLVMASLVYFAKKESGDEESAPKETVSPPPVEGDEETGEIVYTIGRIDPEFKISADDLLAAALQAEKILEQPFGRSFLRYDEHASFKINLQFDERQKQFNEAKEFDFELDKAGESHNIAAAEHKRNGLRIEALERQFASRVDRHNSQMNDYNNEVNRWNAKGGAPPEITSSLNRKSEELTKESAALEAERKMLNKEIENHNRVKVSLDESAKRYNDQVETYNGKFLGRKEFEKGGYNGREINIYQFKNLNDLRVTIAHEFGHAMDIEHTDDPASLMFPLIEKQRMVDFRLTQTDIEAIRKSSFFQNLPSDN